MKKIFLSESNFKATHSVLKSCFLIVTIACIALFGLQASAQTASIALFPSGFTSQTFNSGANDEVTIVQTGCTVSSSSATCRGGNSLRIDANGDNIVSYLSKASTTATLSQVRIVATLNSTTAGVGYIGWSNDGVTYSCDTIILPLNTDACRDVTLTAPANMKYFRLQRQGSNYCASITSTGSQTIRLYQIDVYATAGVVSPTITTSTTGITGLTQAGATPSAGKSYTVSGTNLTAAVTVTAPSGFQVSTDSSTWVSTFNLPVNSGNITGQPVKVYARLNNPVAGTYSDSITHTSSGASTVKVGVSGSTVTTPTITVSPDSLGFGTVVLGGSSAEKSYTISAVLLTPASGNINVVPPSNYFVSLTPGANYAPALSIPYTNNSLSATTIYVTFIPSAVATYNSNIVNSGGGAIANVKVTGAGTLQQVGDYGSVGSGLWSATSTWKTWDGTGFNTAAASAPTATTNVFINPGTTVTVDGSSKVCNNLQVDGTLISSSAVNNPFYINISGTLCTVNTGGQMGGTGTGDAADGLSLHVLNSSFLITGTGGTINLSRLRTNAANTNLVINHDLTLNYHGSTQQGGHTVAFYPNAGDNLTVTLNAGKTWTFAPWACLATTSSSNSNGSFSTTLNINGNLILNNLPKPNDSLHATNLDPNSMIYLGVSSGHTAALNIGGTGSVTTPGFYPNGTSTNNTLGTGQDATVTIASGGLLKVTQTADFRKATQTVTGAGTFTLQAGAMLRIGSPAGITGLAANGPIQTTTRTYNQACTYAYEGTAAQVTGDGLPFRVNNLTFNNAAGVALSADVTVDTALALNGTVVTTNAFKLNVGQSATISRTTGWVNGNEAMRYGIGTTTKNFDIGDATKYTPVSVTLNANGEVGDIIAKSNPGDHPQIAGSTIDPTKSVNRYFTLTKNGPIFLSYNATFNWVASDVDASADPNTFIVGKYDVGQPTPWTYPVPGTRTSTSIQVSGATSFSDFIIGNQMVVTPISDLLSINAKKLVTGGIISWNVAGTNQIQSYELQKSNDGRNFNLLTTVNNMSGQYSYQYSDAVGSSRVDLQACKLEYSIVSPK